MSDARSGRERGAASFSIHNPRANEGTDILRARGRTLTEVARRRDAPRETRRPVKPAGVKSWCVESDVAIGKGVKRCWMRARKCERRERPKDRPTSSQSQSFCAGPI